MNNSSRPLVSLQALNILVRNTAFKLCSEQNLTPKLSVFPADLSTSYSLACNLELTLFHCSLFIDNHCKLQKNNLVTRNKYLMNYLWAISIP